MTINNDNIDENSNNELLVVLLTASRWMCERTKRKRLTGWVVRGKKEWELFASNCINYHGPSELAKNCTAFDFDSFAAVWNWHADELVKNNIHKDFTHKNESLLKDAMLQIVEDRRVERWK